MERIRQNAHGIKVCIDCHIGTGVVRDVNKIPSDEFHKVHIDVDCQACHGAKGSVAIPQETNCDFCHPGDAHFVHGNKTGELCVVCHGSFGVKYKEELGVLRDGEEKRGVGEVAIQVW